MRYDFSRYCRLAVGLVTGLAISTAANADDTGVVRITDRPARTLIRAQSPDDAPLVTIQQMDCERPVYRPATCPPPVCGPSNGLVIGTYPTYDDDDDWEDWEQCRDGGSGECRDLDRHNHHRHGHDRHEDMLFDCPHCQPGDECPYCGGHGYIHGGMSGCHMSNLSGDKLVDCFAAGCDKLLGWVHDGLGLDESGGDGVGVPLIGCYRLTYPVNPSYFDSRDGQVYAAQGYGGPVSVPLAPVVRHTYNYGWGIPSSRLTPISHPMPPIR